MKGGHLLEILGWLCFMANNINDTSHVQASVCLEWPRERGESLVLKLGHDSS
jgi:hypothetical protein